MSVARSQFLENLTGLNQAVKLDDVAAGNTSANVSPGILILRRGILIATLVALEAFVRDRTAELLQNLGRWPARFQDLPQALRDASLLNALPNLQKYAAMLKRQGEDYEAELISQIKKMASAQGPALEFTKFIAGDYTGNISDESFKSLLANFQIKDCWNNFRGFSSDIGLGVPSVHEVMKEIVRKRHRSAHSAGFAPSPTDISGLSKNLLCLGICFDVAMTSSIEQAIVHPNDWTDGKHSWRNGVDLYFVDPERKRYRLVKHGKLRALRVVNSSFDSRRFIPRPLPGRTAVLVERDLSKIPISWAIL